MDQRSVRQAAREITGAIKSRFQNKRTVTEGVVDSVKLDENGKIISATARIDGVPRVPIQVPYGANFSVGARVSVENRGRITSPMWVVSTAVGGYRVPDYSEVGHSHIRSDVTDLNLGSLTAGSPLSISGSPKVIDGGASISFDDSDYLTVSGSRLGATSQAQDFGGFGIKADAISESTSGSGVTIDDVLIKDGGASFQADVDFNSFKAIALVCDNGTTFPSSPALGQWFYFTTANCLFFYDGTRWKPIISFGDMTLYVDGSSGSDSPGRGFSSGSDATATIQYAIDYIPSIIGGNVTIYIASGTYSGFTLPAKQFLGAYTISIYGSVTELDSGTVSSTAINFRTTGTGTVNTASGGSTTVTLSGGGSTSVLTVGAWITANNTTRRVTAITDSTTFTVDSSVDWYNGGSGYSWQYSQCVMIDSSKSWADDYFNEKVVKVGTSSIGFHWIEDTINSSKLVIACNTSAISSGNSYYIYNLNSTISSPTYIYSDFVQIYSLKFADSGHLFFYQSYNCWVVGCYFEKVYITLDRFSYCVIYGCYLNPGTSTSYTAFSLSRYSDIETLRVWAKVYYYYIYALEGPNRLRVGGVRCDHLGSVVPAFRCRQTRVDFTGGRNILHKAAGTYTTGIEAKWFTALEGITTSSNFLSVKFTTPYSTDAYSVAE